MLTKYGALLFSKINYTKFRENKVVLSELDASGANNIASIFIDFISNKSIAQGLRMKIKSVRCWKKKRELLKPIDGVQIPKILLITTCN